MPIQGPFTLIRTVNGISTYEAKLPARSRSLFFSSPPSGMAVLTGEGKALKHNKKTNAGPGTWAFTAETVMVRGKGAVPKDGDFQLEWPTAQEREDALNLATFSSEPESASEQERFIQRSLQVGQSTRTGLLLPAPSEVVYGGRALALNATLSFEARVIPPEAMVRQRSDGSEIIVEVRAPNMESEQVFRGRVGTQDWSAIRVDLSKWSGEVVDVVVRTQDSSDTTLDYVFLADPVIYTPLSDPQRMVLVFLDTTRPDHLGLYGYERDTTPKLDAWAQDAAVFEQARSVAPWTLPSTRSALTGRQPEHWESGPHLAQVLADQGYATGAFVGNVYLSGNFDMSQGWSEYSVENWPTIDEQVEKLQDFMGRNKDRDTLVLLHTMDMHLPYTEPLRYRRKWASKPPGELTWNSTRSPILRAVRKDKAAVQQWVMDRYDQNLAFTDDVLAPLLDSLGADANVLLFSDHGEEFWDHDDFEHGHSLYDELLHVPFILKGPNVPSARVAAPVSLLDLTPTVLDLLGVQAPSTMDMLGLSLLDAIAGDEVALKELETRPQSFGRPLYGQERWGVLVDGQKWTTHQGKQVLVDLKSDPGERKDLAISQDLSAYPAAMAQALVTQAPLSWRINLGKAKSYSDGERVLRISHPNGIQTAWLGQDPLKGSLMAMTGPDQDGAYEVVILPGKKGGREIYVVPTGDPVALEGLSLTWVIPDGDPQASQVMEGASDPPDTLGRPLSTGSVGGRSYSVTWGFAPVPTGKQIDGTNDELTEALHAMGYIERD
ncbi:MAG: arylsulfatase A-like enzyme [Cognaticolwellia sp.]|jgi:arylsulfatase A-like enzyme